MTGRKQRASLSRTRRVRSAELRQGGADNPTHVRAPLHGQGRRALSGTSCSPGHLPCLSTCS
jgi:hypothetical protein